MHAFYLKLATRACAFSNDASLLLTGGESETLDIWDISNLTTLSERDYTEESEVEKFALPSKRVHSHGCWICEIVFFTNKDYKKPINFDPSSADIFASADVRGKVRTQGTDS